MILDAFCARTDGRGGAQAKGPRAYQARIKDLQDRVRGLEAENHRLRMSIADGGVAVPLQLLQTPCPRTTPEEPLESYPAVADPEAAEAPPRAPAMEEEPAWSQGAPAEHLECLFGCLSGEWDPGAVVHTGGVDMEVLF